MSHPFDVLTVENGINFIFTPCPGTKDENLKASLTTLKEAGASAVVSLLTDTEIKALAVEGLGQEIENQGMTWYQLPIEDDSAPKETFFEAFNNAKHQLLALMNSGETIAIHCRGGSGRTGLMAAILLLENGHDWADIVKQIKSIRPKALTHPVHVHFIETHYAI